jgi:hypothetical protein
MKNLKISVSMEKSDICTNISVFDIKLRKYFISVGCILLHNVHIRIFQTHTCNRNWEFFYWCYYISLYYNLFRPLRAILRWIFTLSCDCRYMSERFLRVRKYSHRTHQQQIVYPQTAQTSRMTHCLGNLSAFVSNGMPLHCVYIQQTTNLA